MSTVDERIVSMQFDNQNFEKNISTSQSSLKSFDEQLNSVFTDKSIKNFSTSLKNFSVEPLIDGTEKLRTHFNALSVAGMRVIENLTDMAMHEFGKIYNFFIGGVTSGGLSRAMNIENAKFQLEGLGVAWEKIEKDIDYGVKDTAYGLDAAAKAASSLAASGLEFGGVYEDGAEKISEMGRALRGISGVAAMTNSDYSVIADIFSTIAGNGKLMAMQLMQLSGRGLNAAAKIADYFNGVTDGSIEATESVEKSIKDLTKGLKVGETEIRDFVTKGKISFDIFSEAMDTTFGSHAKEANKTFNGSLSNMRAAMSRIGALFYTPFLKEESILVKFINTVTGKLNDFKKQITPTIAVVTDFGESLIGLGKKAVEAMSFDLSNTPKRITKLINALLNIFIQFEDVQDRVGRLFKTMFPENISGRISILIDEFIDLINNFKLSEQAADNVVKAFKGIFSIIDIGVSAVSVLVKAIAPLPFIFADAFGGVAGVFGDWLYKLNSSIKGTNLFVRVSKKLEEIQGRVSRLFKIVFPESFTERLKNVLDGFSSLILKFQISEKTVNDIVNIFKGLFSIIHLVQSAIGALLSVLEPFTPIISNIVSSVLGFAGSIGVLIQKLDNAITKSGFFVNLFTTIKDSIGPAFDYILLKISEFGSALIDFAHANIQLPSFDGIINALKKPFEGLKNILNGASEIIGNFFSQTEKLDGSFKLTGVTVSLTYFAEKLRLLIQRVKETPLPPLISNLKNVLNQASVALNKFTQSIKFNNLQKIAVSVGILTASLTVLTLLDTNKLASSLGVITGLMIDLVAAMTFMENQKVGANLGYLNLTTNLIAISVGVLFLASAMKKLSSIDVEGMKTGLTAVTILLSELVIAFIAISRFGKITLSEDALSIIALAAGINILASAMEKIAKIDPSGAQQAIECVSAIMALYTMLLLFSQNANLGAKAGIAFISIAASMVILSNAIEKLGGMDSKALEQGTTTVIAMMAFIAVVGVLISVINQMQAMSMKDIGAPFTGLEKSLLTFSGSMVMIAAAMIILEKAVEGFGNMKFEALAQGLLAVLASLAMFGGLSVLMSRFAPNIMLVAGALAIFAVALNLLVPALVVLGTFSNSMGKAIINLFGIIVAFGAFAAVGVAVAEFIPIIYAFIGALTLFGVAIAAVGAGIFLFASGMTMLAASGAAGAASFVAIITMITTILPTVATALALSITTFIVTLAGGAALIVKALSTLISTILDALIQNIPKLVQVGILLVNGLIDGLRECIPNLIETGLTIIDSFLQSVASHIDSITEAGANIVISYINGIATKLPDIIQAGIDLALAFINGTADGIRNNYQAVEAAVWNLITAILSVIIGNAPDFLSAGIDIISSFLSGVTEVTGNVLEVITKLIGDMLIELGVPEDFVKVGVDLVNGFINGIKQGTLGVINTVKNLGQTALNKLREVLDSHSDSKETIAIGNDTGHGFQTGVEQTESGVTNLMEKFGIKSIKSLATGVDEGGSYLDRAMDGVNEMYSKHVDQLENDAKRARWATDLKNSLAVKSFVRESKSEQRSGYYTAAHEMSKAKSAAKELGEQSDETSKSLDNLGKSAGGAGKASKEAANSFKSYADLKDSVKQSIEGSIDLFSEFDKKAELTSDKLLENMRSQVTGVSEWAQNLTILATKGIDKGLLQKLTDMGPKGYEQVNAFVNMTSDQLAEANSLYAQSMMLPDSASSAIADSFAYAGMWASDGFVNGVDPQAAYQPGDLMGQTLLKGTMDALDEHSPSKETEELGNWAVEGFIKGLSHQFYINKIKHNAENLGKTALDAINLQLENSSFDKVGSSVVSTFVDGLKDKSDDIKDAIKKFCDKLIAAMKQYLPDNTFREIGYNLLVNIKEGSEKGINEYLLFLTKKTEGLNKQFYDTFLKIGEYASKGLAKGISSKMGEITKSIKNVTDAAEKAAKGKKGFDERSPSKKFFGIGEYVTLGLANGIKSMTGSVVSSVDSVSSDTITAFQNAVSKISDYVNDSTDADMVLTPVLDLSEVQTGVDAINSLMSNQQITLDATMDNIRLASSAFSRSREIPNVPTEPQQIINNNNYEFNQTNNSPKSLSNAEIYRQTNTLFSRYRRLATS